MNTGAQTAVIPLYIKECNFFYLFYLTFGSINLLNILMHTYTMLIEVSKNLNIQMCMNLHAMKKKIGDLADFPNITYEEFEIVIRT